MKAKRKVSLKFRSHSYSKLFRHSMVLIWDRVMIICPKKEEDDEEEEIQSYRVSQIRLLFARVCVCVSIRFYSLFLVRVSFEMQNID